MRAGVAVAIGPFSTPQPPPEPIPPNPSPHSHLHPEAPLFTSNPFPLYSVGARHGHARCPSFGQRAPRARASGAGRR